MFLQRRKVEDRLHGTVIGSMAEDKEGNLYVASEGSGINVLNKNREVIRHITKTTHRLPDNKIRALWYDEQTDNLFISVYKNGLYVLDRKTGRNQADRFFVFRFGFSADNRRYCSLSGYAWCYRLPYGYF